MEYSEGTEQLMIDALRTAGKLEISLVAEFEKTIIGHVAFSRGIVTGSTECWFALGPIAVEIEHQRRGVGTALIESGLAKLRADHAAGCIVVGDPNYYARFGFLPFPALAPPGQPPEYFMILPLQQKSPHLVVNFQPEFG